MGSRVLGAASACLVASGLFARSVAGGAEPWPSPTPVAHNVPGEHSSEGSRQGRRRDRSRRSSDSRCDEGRTKSPTDKTKTDERQARQRRRTKSDAAETGPTAANRRAAQRRRPTLWWGLGVKLSTTRADDANTNTRQSRRTRAAVDDRMSRPVRPTATSKTTETTTPTTTRGGLGLPPPGGSGSVGGGGGGGGAIEVPPGIPRPPAEVQLPPAAEQSVLDAVPGVGAAAAQLPVQPITLPVIVAPSGLGLGGGGGAPAPRAPSLPSAPRGVTAEPPAGREPLPAHVGSNVKLPPSSFRIGYTEYLRNAGLSQVAALAVPGVAGMLVLTGAGGLVGYRQAKAGHAVHTNGAARFVN